MRRSIKYLAAAAAAALPAIAGAQAVNFVGATRGCFYTSIVCAPSGVFGSGSVSLFDANSVARVTYHYGSFNIFTQPSSPSGASGAAIGGGAGQNYGVATVSTGAHSFGVGGQHLLIEFMVTGPTLGGNTPYYTSKVFTLVGTVGTTAGSGGPSFFTSYPGAGDIFTGNFTNGQVFGGGTATGTVDDWTYDTNNTTTGQTSPFTGRVDITSDIVTPEPASLGLLGTGLAALLVGYRRRRTV